MNKAILAEYGIDYEKGLARCMNDNGFYERFLGMFLQDDAFARAKKAFEEKDRQSLFRCAHELKGTCGNADLTELFKAVCPLVELLRSGEAPEEEVAKRFAAVETAYGRAITGVTLAIEG